VLDQALVGYILSDQKHPAEAINLGVKVMVLSDITADHSQDDKKDRMSLGVFFQQVLDSTPLTFPSANMARKGYAYTPDLILITTNERMISCSEATARLGRRFDESAVIVDLSVVETVGGKQRNVPETEFRRWSTAKRNEHLCVKMYKAVCTGKTISFTHPVSNSWTHVSNFLLYMNDRILLKPQRDVQKKAVITQACECGIMHHMHYVGGEYKALTTLCVQVPLNSLLNLEPLCDCMLENGHRHNPIWDHSMNESSESRRNESIAGAPRVPPRPLKRAVTPTFLGGVGKAADIMELSSGVVEISLSLFCVWVVWAYFSQTLRAVRADLFEGLERVENLYNKAQLTSNFYQDQLLYWRNEEEKIKSRAYGAYLRLKMFVRSYGKVICAGGALVAIVSYLRKSSMTNTAKVVLRENTDPNSLVIDSYTQQISYPKELAEQWNKKPEPLKIVHLSTIGSSHDDLAAMVRKSTFPAAVITPDKKRREGYAIVLNASWLIMNYHSFFPKGEFMESILMFHDIPTHIGRNDIQEVFVEGFPTDVVLVRNPFPGPCRDLLKFFSDGVGVDQVSGRVCVPTQEKTGNFLVQYGLPSSVPPNERFTGRTWNIKQLGLEGECGSLSLGECSNGSFLLGIVSYKISSSFTCWQGGNILTRKALIEAMERHPEPMVNDLTATLDLSDLVTLMPNSEFRNISTPFLTPIGSRHVHQNKFSSDFKETLLKPLIDEKNLLSKPYGIIKATHGLEVVDGEKQFVSAFGQTMNGIKPLGLINSDALRRACNKYVTYIAKGIHEKLGKIRLSPLTLEESFFGNGDMDVLRCNFVSSIGPEDRFYKDRNGIFDFDAEKELYRANPAFTMKVQSFIKELKQNVAKMPWVCGSYKDEIRSLEKLMKFKIRLFYTVDVYTNTVSRMFLQPLVQVLLRYPYLSKCFGKMNSGSVEWDTFFKYIMKGKFQLDLDFANFDISHYFRLMREVAWFFYQLAMLWYGHEESARIVYLLVYALGCQLFEHKGDFAMKVKGLPSGHIVTLILNSIINILLMMVAFEMLYPDKDFFEEVFPGVVGDDNLAGVSESVSEKFNLVNLQEIYKGFGYAVTDASKSSVVKPFVSPQNMQFLKRKFRYEPRLKLVVAPLEKDSIYKMLSFWSFKKQGGASYTQRMAACLDTAQREMFLHGEEEFSAFQAIFQKPCTMQGLFVKWYTFEELAVMYLNGEQFMSW
jgi:mRNA-degrading endonuclease RelE of RelBE toxin-antitoxin system